MALLGLWSVGLSRPCSLTPWWWVVVAGVTLLARGRGVSVHGGRRHCPPLFHENLQLVAPTWAPAASSFIYLFIFLTFGCTRFLLLRGLFSSCSK